MPEPDVSDPIRLHTGTPEQLPLFEPVGDDDVRHAVAAQLDATLFVEAGAGSGKTTALVNRVLGLVLDAGVPVREIAAITFTEKAAAELRTRVRTRLVEVHAAETDDERRRVSAQALDDLDGAAISTLHAFAQRILAEHPIEAGLPPGVEILDEISSAVAFDDWWADTVDAMLDDPDLERTILLGDAVGISMKRLREVALAFHDNWDLVAERIDATPTDPPAVHLDGIISGLRGVVEQRRHCLDADDKLLARLDGYAVLLERIDGTADESERLTALGEQTFRVGNVGRPANWNDEVTVADLRADVASIGEACEELRGRVVEACLDRFAATIARSVLDAAAERRSSGRLEFHDLLVLARSMLRDAQHGVEVRASLQSRYARLLLDEFQDTDPIQIELAVLIATDDPQAGVKPWHDVEVPAGRLFFVGDPKQSIYRFRRADIALFLRARAVFSTGTHQLSRNFRSSRPVIDWVNRVFGHLIRHEEGSQPEYRPLDATRDAVAGPGVAVLGADAHPVGTTAAVLRSYEAHDVVGAIVAAVSEPWKVVVDDVERPAQLGDITVLLPARTSLTALEQALDKAGIAHRAESSSLVYSSAEVRDLLSVLRAIDDVTDELALVVALRSPAFGCGDDDLHRYHVEHGGRWNHQAPPPAGLGADDPVVAGMTWLGERHRERLWMTPSELIGQVTRERYLMELGYASGRARDLWRRLRFVTDQARAYHDAEGGTLRDFLEWADRQSSDGARVVETILPETDDDSVRIMTIHAAKGLEFPIAIVSGMTTRAYSGPRGTQVVFPPEGGIGIRLDAATATPAYDRYQPIDEQMGYHERLRLLYVAATRARDHLVVSLHRAERKRPTSDAVKLTSAELILDAATETAATHVELEVDVAELDVASTTGVAPLDLTRTQWRAEQERAVETGARRRAVAATTLAQMAADAADPGLAKEPRDLDLPPWNRGRYGTAIGRAVHAVLQVVDLETGDGLDAAVSSQAAAEGIVAFEETIARLARSALQAPTVREAAQHRRWRELFVTVPMGESTLEGYVDLLYRTDEGLVVVDYKTDAWRDDLDLDDKVARYRVQAAAYAVAVERATAEPVARCVLLFLGEERVVERVVDDLDGARQVVLDLLEQQAAH